MVLWSSTALCAAGLTNSLKIGLPYYSKPRLVKLRQTGTVAVWLKTLKPMMLLFTGNQWFNECKPRPPTQKKKHFLWRVNMLRCQRTPRVTTATVASSLGGRMYVDDYSNCREKSTHIVTTSLLPRLPCNQQHVKSSGCTSKHLNSKSLPQMRHSRRHSAGVFSGNRQSGRNEELSHHPQVSIKI